MKVDETSLLHAILLQVLREDVDPVSDAVSSLDPDLAPLGQGRVLGQGTVVRRADTRGIQMLDPTTRLQAPISLPVDRIPVLDGAGKPADVDVVEVVVRVGPLLGGVVDFEAQVGGHPAGLDGRKVGAGYMAVGELVGHVDGPESYTKLVSYSHQNAITMSTYQCRCQYQ